MDCIVRKLKATVNNANLPEFKNVVLKSYIATTEDAQYIQLTGIFVQLNAVKMSGVFQIADQATQDEVPVFGVDSNEYIQKKRTYLRAVNVTDSSVESAAANTDISAGFDGSDGSYFLGETTGTCSTPQSSTSLVETMMVFGTRTRTDQSKAGHIKIKSIHIEDQNHNEYDLVPAEVNGVACLYDADRGNVYTEANGGTLVCY